MAISHAVKLYAGKVTVIAPHVPSFAPYLAENAGIILVNALPKRPGWIYSSLKVYPSQQFAENSEMSAQGTHFKSWQWPNMSNLSKFISFDTLSEFEHKFGYSPPRKLISRARDALSNSTRASCYSWSFFAAFSHNYVVSSAIGAPKCSA